MRTPTLGPYEYLDAIAATGPDDVWVVGARWYAIDSGPVPIALHWNGDAWRRFRVPRAIVDPNVGGGGGALLDVTAVARDDVWAAGLGNGFDDENDEGLVVHWDGERWHRSPWDSGNLFGVSVGSAGDVWVVGDNDKEVAQPEAAVLRDSGWQPLSWDNPYVAWFDDINAEGPVVWAVGGYYTPDTESALIERWDGDQFRMLPVDGAIDLYGVTQLASGEAFALGQTATRSPTIERWRNDHWSPMHLPAGWAQRSLDSIEAGPDGSVWAVGSFIARSCIKGR